MICHKYHDEKQDLENSIFQMLTLDEFRTLGLGGKDAQAMVSKRNLAHIKENGVGGYLRPGGDKLGSFRGKRTPDEITARCTKGWREGAQKMAGLTRDIGNVLTTLGVKDTRRRAAWREDGDDLDLDRFWNGDYDTCWRTSVRDARGMFPVVSLISSWGGHCGRNARELFWSGAAALVRADALEDAGYSVELVLCNTTRQGYDKSWGCASAIQIKRSDQPLNIEALAGVGCDVGVFRTYGFNTMPLVGGKKHMCDGSLGRPTSAHLWDHGKWPTEGTPIMMPDSFTMDEAITSVRKTLEGYTSPQQQGA